MDAKKFIETHGELNSFNTAFEYMMDNPGMITRPAKKLVNQMWEKYGGLSSGIEEMYQYIDESWLCSQYGRKKTSRIEKFIESYLYRIEINNEMSQIKTSINPILLVLENEFDDLGIIAACSKIYQNAGYTKQAKYAILNCVAHHFENILENVEEMLYSVHKAHQQEINKINIIP